MVTFGRQGTVQDRRSLLGAGLCVHELITNQSSFKTGVLRVVPANAQQPDAPPTTPAAHPPATDAAPAVQLTMEQALRSHAALMPQLRTTLCDVGITLPWPSQPPLPSHPPPPLDEASSAPNLKTMVEELARLRTQGTTLVQQQQADTMSRHADTAPPPKSPTTSLDTTSPVVAPPRARRASTPPGVYGLW